MPYFSFFAISSACDRTFCFSHESVAFESGWFQSPKFQCTKQLLAAHCKVSKLQSWDGAVGIGEIWPFGSGHGTLRRWWKMIFSSMWFHRHLWAENCVFFFHSLVPFCWSCKIIGRFFQKQTLEVEYCTLFYFQRFQSFLLARSVSPMQSLEKLRKRKKILRRKILKRRTQKRRQSPEFLRVSMIQKNQLTPADRFTCSQSSGREGARERGGGLSLWVPCFAASNAFACISSLLCAGPSVAIALWWGWAFSLRLSGYLFGSFWYWKSASQHQSGELRSFYHLLPTSLTQHLNLQRRSGATMSHVCQSRPPPLTAARRKHLLCAATIWLAGQVESPKRRLEGPGGQGEGRKAAVIRCCVSFVSFIFHLSPGLGRFWKKQVGEKEGATGGLYCTGCISYIILDVHNVCTMVLKVLKCFLVLRILDAGLLRFTVRQRNYTFQVPRWSRCMSSFIGSYTILTRCTGRHALCKVRQVVRPGWLPSKLCVESMWCVPACFIPTASHYPMQGTYGHRRLLDHSLEEHTRTDEQWSRAGLYVPGSWFGSLPQGSPEPGTYFFLIWMEESHHVSSIIVINPLGIWWDLYTEDSHGMTPMDVPMVMISGRRFWWFPASCHCAAAQERTAALWPRGDQ